MSEESFLEQSQQEKELAIENRLREWRDFMYSKRAMETHQKFLQKAKKLQAKYTDFEEYHLYHILISSTKDRAASHSFDFPEEDSVEQFISQAYEDFDK